MFRVYSSCCCLMLRTHLLWLLLLPLFIRYFSKPTLDCGLINFTLFHYIPMFRFISFRPPDNVLHSLSFANETNLPNTNATHKTHIQVREPQSNNDKTSDYMKMAPKDSTNSTLEAESDEKGDTQEVYAKIGNTEGNAKETNATEESPEEIFNEDDEEENGGNKDDKEESVLLDSASGGGNKGEHESCAVTEECKECHDHEMVYPSIFFFSSFSIEYLPQNSNIIFAES